MFTAIAKRLITPSLLAAIWALGYTSREHVVITTEAGSADIGYGSLATAALLLYL
jgi:hypothetical protein